MKSSSDRLFFLPLPLPLWSLHFLSLPLPVQTLHFRSLPFPLQILHFRSLPLPLQSLLCFSFPDLARRAASRLPFSRPLPSRLLTAHTHTHTHTHTQTHTHTEDADDTYDGRAIRRRSVECRAATHRATNET